MLCQEISRQGKFGLDSIRSGTTIDSANTPFAWIVLLSSSSVTVVVVLAFSEFLDIIPLSY